MRMYQIILFIFTFWVNCVLYLAAQSTLDGLYSGLRVSGGFSSGVSKDYMSFFPNGTVLWRLPDEGLLKFDVAASKEKDPESWGTYQIQKGAIRIQWSYGKVTNGYIAHDGSLILDGYTYHYKDKADGYRIAGTYFYPTYFETTNTSVITFFENGQFQDYGVRRTVGLMDLAYGNPKVPTHPGTGTYTIAENSIILKYSDGRQEQLSFYTADVSTKTPEFIVIHTYCLNRINQ